MKIATQCAVLLVMLASFVGVPVAELKGKVKVETLSVGLHPGMDPGMYVCAGGHLHIKATVQNLTGATLRTVKVEAKAFDAAGNLLGTATASPKAARLAPNETAEVDLEFLTVTGRRIDAVKGHELAVVEATGSR